MTKQEEIREGLIKYLAGHMPVLFDHVPTEEITRMLYHVLQHLHGQGVVLVDKERKLPNPILDIHIWREYSPNMAYEKALQDMLKAGWKPVVSLVEEEK